jgi:hypothetical protein
VQVSNKRRRSFSHTVAYQTKSQPPSPRVFLLPAGSLSEFRPPWASKEEQTNPSLQVASEGSRREKQNMNQTDGPWPSPLVRMRGKTFNSLIKEDGISNYQLFFSLCPRQCWVFRSVIAAYCISNTSGIGNREAANNTRIPLTGPSVGFHVSSQPTRPDHARF